MVTNMAQKLTLAKDYQAPAVTFGVCATGDPRVDKASRERARNIIGMVADAVAKRVKMPDGRAVNVVYSDLLIDGEKQADVVARQFRLAGVDAVIMAPDTWAFPQLTLISLLAQLPDHTPVNITCGNSGPKPGVVFAHAANGGAGTVRKVGFAECRYLARFGYATQDDKVHRRYPRGLVLRSCCENRYAG